MMRERSLKKSIRILLNPDSVILQRKQIVVKSLFVCYNTNMKKYTPYETNSTKEKTTLR